MGFSFGICLAIGGRHAHPAILNKFLVNNSSLILLAGN